MEGMSSADEYVSPVEKAWGERGSFRMEVGCPLSLLSHRHRRKIASPSLMSASSLEQ